MSYERIPLADADKLFPGLTELQSVAIGGQVASVSDDFFASADQLLLAEPAPSLKGQFGPNGALFSGWESRRHNPTYDWCIIKLGTSGTIQGFDVDTAHFNGNEAPEVSIDALLADDGETAPRVDDPKEKSSRVNYVKLNMYPDGGIARFRVYGQVAPVLPDDPMESFDLAHVFAGGKVVFTSDQHFGVGSNLILPGRGKDMGDGWETKRSRQKGHNDWAVIELGTPGILETTEIDTAHFKGNFPESCELHATNVQDSPPSWKEDSSIEWTEILPRTKLGPHRQHYFQLQNTDGQIFTHVKVTIHPDGGIKRVRVIGKRADSTIEDTATNGHANGDTNGHTNGHSSENVNEHSNGHTNSYSNGTPDGVSDGTSSNGVNDPKHALTRVPVLPLTPEAFAPFGQVIQAYNENAAPRGTKITPANNGTASKFHKLALLESSYPSESGATSGISVYRCTPPKVDDPALIPINQLERHACTNQSFIPMSSGGSDSLESPSTSYVVVVAPNGVDDKPDTKGLRAFHAGGAQGIVYGTGVWHLPMTVLQKPMDFACIETQVGDGCRVDCEIVDIKQDIVVDVSRFL